MRGLVNSARLEHRVSRSGVEGGRGAHLAFTKAARRPRFMHFNQDVCSPRSPGRQPRMRTQPPPPQERKFTAAFIKEWYFSPVRTSGNESFAFHFASFAAPHSAKIFYEAQLELRFPENVYLESFASNQTAQQQQQLIRATLPKFAAALFNHLLWILSCTEWEFKSAENIAGTSKTPLLFLFKTFGLIPAQALY